MTIPDARARTAPRPYAERDFMSLERPAIRPLDVQRVDEPQGTGRGVVLVDRLGISEPAFIPEGMLPIVGRCTGERSLAEIRAEAESQYAEPLTLEAVTQLVQQLDERLLLIGARYEAAAATAAAAFMAGGTRPSSQAGSAGYPRDPDELRRALDRLLDAAPAPDVAPTALRGLIAPHIDLHRGAAGYASAYRRLLAAEPADLYVVFGTGHAGPSAPVTGLLLDWQTPLGTVPTDREFVLAVHDRLGAPDPTDLLIHRDEHSLEFQVLLLQHIHARRATKTPFRVAGFLCGALPSGDGDPLCEAFGQQLIATFRAAEAAATGRVCYIAGADLAHIGPFFGDPAPVDDARLDRLAAIEQQRLTLLERGQPGPFHAAVECDRNPDRVCSAPAITLTAALAGGAGELLHYGQARAADDSQTVSFCAMSFAGAVQA